MPQFSKRANLLKDLDIPKSLQ